LHWEPQGLYVLLHGRLPLGFSDFCFVASPRRIALRLPAGSVNPCRDLDIIHNELLKKDIAFTKSKMEGMRKAVTKGDCPKDVKEEWNLLERLLKWMEVDGKEARHGEWGPTDIENLNRYQLLTAKPVRALVPSAPRVPAAAAPSPSAFPWAQVIYLVNMSEKGYVSKKGKFLPALAEWLKARGSDDKMIPFSCEFEAKLADMSPEDAAKYCEAAGGAKSAAPRIIRTGYHALQLVHFFTAGEDEVRAWSVKRDSPAPRAAGTIHTDFEKCFISADVISFTDFKELGTEAAVRAAGKLRMEGRKYEVQVRLGGGGVTVGGCPRGFCGM